jgi:circadian clock protein KaiC
MQRHASAILPYLPTHLSGLDVILGGGIPEGSFNLITGSSGTGKTTLAHQLMFGLATPERTALYISSLGESPLKMLRHQQQFDFFNLDHVNRSVHLVNLALTSSSGNLNQVLEQIHREVELRKPAFVFIDSFRSLFLGSSLAQKTGQQMGSTAHPSTAEFMYRLGLLMSSWHSNELHQFHIESDGIHLDAALHGHEGLLSGRPAALTNGSRVTAP